MEPSRKSATRQRAPKHKPKSDLREWYKRLAMHYDAETVTAEYMAAHASLKEMQDSIDTLRRFVEDRKKYDALLVAAVEELLEN